MDADVFISLTHFKGHESTGFGGTIKNIGMGCGSRAGKKNSIVQVLHMLMKSYVVVVNNALKNVRIMDWNMMKQYIRCISMKRIVLDVDVV